MMFPAQTAAGRKQLRETRENHRAAYAVALEKYRDNASREPGDRDVLEKERAGMAEVDGLFLEEKLRIRQVETKPIDWLTGSVTISCWNKETGQFVKQRLESFEAAIDFISTNGWPLNMEAELVGGGRTFITMRMSPWDEDYSCYWYRLYTSGGGNLIAKEERGATV